MDVLTNGTHGSTFGGNPICCAGAINVLDRIDDRLLDGVAKRSQIIFDSLTGAEGIKAISGIGLMLGIETEKFFKHICKSLDIIRKYVVDFASQITMELKVPHRSPYGQKHDSNEDERFFHIAIF